MSNYFICIGQTSLLRWEFRICAACSPPRYLLPSPLLHWANQSKTPEIPWVFLFFSPYFPPFSSPLFFQVIELLKTFHSKVMTKFHLQGSLWQKSPVSIATGHIQNISRVLCLQSSNPQIFGELISPWGWAEGGDPAEPEDGMWPLSLCPSGSSLTGMGCLTGVGFKSIQIKEIFGL